MEENNLWWLVLGTGGARILPPQDYYSSGYFSDQARCVPRMEFECFSSEKSARRHLQLLYNEALAEYSAADTPEHIREFRHRDLIEWLIGNDWLITTPDICRELREMKLAKIQERLIAARRTIVLIEAEMASFLESPIRAANPQLTKEDPEKPHAKS
jgi:hypothetical protein